MLKTILSQFRKFFPPSTVNAISRQCGLVMRSTSRIKGIDFLILLLHAVNSPTELSLNSFCRILHQENKKVKMKAQSLWERIVNPDAVSFMQRMYAETLAVCTENIKIECSKLSCTFFKQFSQVLIEDSTIVSLNERLFNVFKGSGGSASRSSLKIHVIFDMITNKFNWIKIIKDRRPDRSLTMDVINAMGKGALLIRDLGFFSLDAFEKIREQGSYFVSRLHVGVNVYLNRTDKKPIDLIRYIKTKHRWHCGSLEVFLGDKHRLPVRLVFYHASEDIINKRKRLLKRNAQRKGQTPSQCLLTWQEYTIFITNLSEEVASVSLIGTIYRLRWEIELIFKTWKSHLNLDVLKGTRAERIEVFLYAKLIGILLLGIVCEYLQVLCAKMCSGCEISIAKVAQLLGSMNFFSGLFKGSQGGRKMEFLSDEYWIQSLCKQKRKRKTTLERINALESFGIIAC